MELEGVAPEASPRNAKGTAADMARNDRREKTEDGMKKYYAFEARIEQRPVCSVLWVPSGETWYSRSLGS
jgi:hypothetical protein